MTAPLPTVPMAGLAGEIEAVIGSDKAQALLRQRGGTEITIPVRPDNSTLAAIVGLPAAAAMIAHFGAGRLKLPLSGARGIGARRRLGFDMLQAGASLSEVALACEVDERTVSRWRAEIEAEARSPQLRMPF
jgi:hypothetical protein